MLKGAERRERRTYELAMFQAWQAGRMGALAGAGKLKPMKHYLAELRPARGQSPEEMLATLKALRSGGVPMKIRKVEDRGSAG